MKITAQMARDAFEPLTGRELAWLLKTYQVGINERKVRHIMAGRDSCPLVLYNAALWLQQEHEKLSDSEYEQLLDTTHKQMRSES
jgi:hypothetical protein